MLYSGTGPESYITEYPLVYEDKIKVEAGNADAPAARRSESPPPTGVPRL